MLSVDCGAAIDGWAADAATTVVVGHARDEDLRLVAATAEVLAAACRCARDW